MKLEGAVAIVTGASHGIGRAIAIEFGRQGAQVALAARNSAALDEVATTIRGAGGRAEAIPTDVTDGGQVERLVQATIDALGPVDILVNNAGIGLHAPIGDARSADVEALFRLNVVAAAACIRAVVPVMRAQRAGMVINISSVAGRIALPRAGYYSASKFALTVIGDALRMEEAHRGIRVMNVFPGMTRSDFGRNRLGDPGRAPHQRLVAPVAAEKVARRIAQAVRRNRNTVYISWFPDRIGVASNWLAGGAISAVLRRWARGAEE